MVEDTLRYDKMVEDALRGVVRQALRQVAAHGLVGDHHFYITFLCNHPDVQLAPRLRAKHPEEMTIVLQHQFWDLNVEEDRFSVTLSFGGASECLVVPLAAITGFADPSAKFGLQFQTETVADDEDEEILEDEAPESTESSAPESGDGKVVALDAFRKK